MKNLANSIILDFAEQRFIIRSDFLSKGNPVRLEEFGAEPYSQKYRNSTFAYYFAVKRNLLNNYHISLALSFPGRISYHTVYTLFFTFIRNNIH